MIGQQVGSYRVVRKLGEGGMGAVYEAVHDKLERRAAIKVLHPEVSRSPEVAARFFNEARAVNIIDHPGLVEIYEFGQLPDGAAYIVMEYLKGESLQTRLGRMGGRLVEAEAVRLGRQVASALLAAHEKSIVHRDLKPDNVFIVPDPEAPGGERAKVLDFGIAKLSEGPGAAAEHVKTRTGMLMGTPAYMSPEQCRGAGGVDARSDVYSLGVMLYQMLTGQLPFMAEGLGELLIKHITEPPRPIAQLAPGVSPELSTLVHAMLAKTAPERLPMERVVAELTRLGGGQSQPPVSLPGPGAAPLPTPPPAYAAGAGPSAGPGTASSMPPTSPAPPPGTPLAWTRGPSKGAGSSLLPWALGGAALLAIGAWRLWPRQPDAVPLAQQTAGAGGMVIPAGLPKEVQEQIRKAQEAGLRAQRQAERMAQGLPEEGQVSLLSEEGVKQTVARFQERLGGGPVKAMKLVLYAPYAILSAQVPGEPDHVDQYTYRSGRVGDAEPVRISQDLALEDYLFPLSELKPALVPRLAQEALDRAGLPDGHVTHVMVEWDRSFTKRKVIRVYVNGKRNSAMLVADFAGEILKFVKN